MTKILYIPKRFRSARRKLIEISNQIIDEYLADGYDLTVRQLYYQLVARDYIPNNQSSYDRVSETISDARLAGMVSWQAIKDRTRRLLEWPTYDSPADAVYRAYQSYNTDKWQTQPYRPEIWVEKEALSGVVARPANDLDIPYIACRGYMSQTAMWQAGERIINNIKSGQVPFIIHLGDHDPSGMDMTRDIIDRLKVFLFKRFGVIEGKDYQVTRIALNMPQVEQYNPPPNYAKLTDSRASEYIAK